jgi:hypothetical protein
MDITPFKNRFSLCALFILAMTIAACGEYDLETQIIENNANENESFPPEVEKAIQEGVDEVEVPFTVSEGGISKPTSFSTVYFIDYQEDSTSTKQAPSEAPSGNANCGTASAYSVKSNKWKIFPLIYKTNTTNLTVGVDVAAAKAAVANAFKTWDDENRPILDVFIEAAAGETPKVTVTWGRVDGKGKALAIASNTYNTKTKEIISAKLTFDHAEKWTILPSLSCESQGADFDIENIAAHEVGHILGLQHPSKNKKNKSLTLFPSSAPGETLKRTLDNGDKLGMAKLYPKKK